MSNVILTLDWDGGGPAHSGQCSIRRTRKGFVVDDEVEPQGPLTSLEEALAFDSFHFGGTPSPHLRCSAALAASEPVVKAAFDLAGEVGGEVRINGTRFRRVGAGLIKTD